MMKQQQRTFLCAFVVALAFFSAACGGKETMASKSASAYHEAKTKGTPVGGGHEHGGHAIEGATDHSTMTDRPAMDHSTMAGMDPSQSGSMDHSTMDHSTMDHSTMDHSTMTGTDHSKMTAADHSHMAGMDHATTTTNHSSMAGMDHSTTSTDHSSMAGMDHSGAQPGSTAGVSDSAMQGMHHGAPSAAVAVVTAAPRSSAEIGPVDPAATLRPDAFDAPAAVSVAEAAKAAGGGSHAGHAMHGTDEAVVYTCPMHPDVRSATPGQCPKCGMTLVKTTAGKER